MILPELERDPKPECRKGNNYVLPIPLVAFGTHSENLTTTTLNSLVQPSLWCVISRDSKIIVRHLHFFVRVIQNLQEREELGR